MSCIRSSAFLRSVSVAHPNKPGVVMTLYPSLEERQKAAEWLTAYAYGRPHQMLEVESRSVQPINIYPPGTPLPAPADDKGRGSGTRARAVSP